MRLSVIFTVVTAVFVFVATVTANKHKKTPCDICTDGYNTCDDRYRKHRSERICKAECDCEKGKDETCHMCGHVTTAIAGSDQPTCDDCPSRMVGCLESWDGGKYCKVAYKCQLSQVDIFCKDMCQYGCDKPMGPELPADPPH
ncbi:uncharacterized protein M421DRAFT_6031 [Didymella exigua CBS 183.55]|uniref:TNFR-Cys domain-containing protein n=1 Tax=Didymella exigua CBS 183.55 TaxID=1150837 RepID=A0A6A5RQL9_9PLEO|nr:uncharacterized protein M421DRAFT_6031 [Didymella exigua CBS 183.55]KAF1927777.1 hypothetical protein M421DRAFT_6031 [Didymella exigua CBS 183.55]